MAALVLASAAGVYLLFDDPGGAWHMQAAPVLPADGPQEPDQGPALALAGGAQRPKPLEAPAARGQPITGVVRAPTGAACAGVTVEIVHEAPLVDPLDPDSALAWQRAWVERMANAVAAPAPPTVEASVVTDDKGTFSFVTARRGTYRVRAAPAPPQFGTQARVIVKNVAPSPITLHVGPGHVLTGHVLDRSDRPVSATLVLRSRKIARGTWQSDPLANDPTTGAFTFPPAPPGTYDVDCIVPGSLRLRGLEVTLPRDEPLVIRVPAGGASLTGTIKGPGGEPVRGAHIVAVVPIASEGVRVEGVGRSNEDGRYAVAHLPPGPLTKLTVGAAGYLDHVGTVPLAPWAGTKVPATGTTHVHVTLQKGGAVHGRVLLADGKPLADATVVVVPSRWRPPAAGAPGALIAKTSEEGTYRIDGVPVGKHVLFARHETHYVPALESVANAGGPPDSLLVLIGPSAEDVHRDITMAPGVPISGRVLTEDDEPVAGARVVTKSGQQHRWWGTWGVALRGAGVGPLATTDDEGTFILRALPPKSDWVFAAATDDSYGKWCEPISNEAGPKEDVTLRVLSGVAVRGTVVDDDGPVAGISVTLYSRNRTVQGAHRSTTTDAEGAFEFLGVPEGDANVQARDDGRHAYKRVKGITKDEDKEDIEIKLKARGETLSGVLRDEDGNPLHNFRMQARGNGGRPYATTDTQGRFTFHGAPKGLVKIRVRQPGGSWEYVKEKFHSPGEDLEVTFAPKVQRVIEGRVLAPDKTLVPLVQVQMGVGDPPKERRFRHRALIGQEVVGGTFKMTVLGEGPVWIRAQAARDRSGHPLGARAVTKAFDDEQAKRPVEVVLEEGLAVRGTVVGPSGQGVAEALVRSGRFSARTTSTGTFALQGLPEGELSIHVQPPVDFSAPPAAKARAGDTDVEIKLLRAAELRGQLTDAHGTGMSPGRVYVRWKDPVKGENRSRSTHVDGEGRFVVKGIPAGVRVSVEARLWGRDNRGRVAQPLKDVDPNAGPVTLVAERGAVITGFVEDERGQPVANVHISAKRNRHGRRATLG